MSDIEEHTLKGMDLLPERFREKVYSTTCWIWGTSQTVKGYGVYSIGQLNVSAHRYAYEAVRGPIPEGLELDHLCRVKACVNPWHLEPVTHAENVQRAQDANAAEREKRRKTHCPSGHPYDDTNTYVNPRGRRECRTCRSAASERARQKRVSNG